MEVIHIVDITLAILQLVQNREANYGASVEPDPTFFRLKNPPAINSGVHSLSTLLTLHGARTKVIRRPSSYILAREKTCNGICDPVIFIRNYNIWYGTIIA